MCQHHWEIEPANGPQSWGECRLCHETKEFENGTPAVPPWGNTQGQNSLQIRKDAQELAQSADEDNAELALVYER